MFQYVHQLEAKCVCLLFGAEQVVFSNSLPGLPRDDANRELRGTQNNKVVVWTDKVQVETHYKALLSQGKLQARRPWSQKSQYATVFHHFLSVKPLDMVTKNRHY